MTNNVLRGAALAAMLGALVAVTGVLAQNVDPFDEGRKFAWGENIGWLNARPEAPGDPGVQVAGDRLTGYIWGENVGWINLSCINNDTCESTGDYGVRHDGMGNLSGYAWGENVGWISFSCMDASESCATTDDYGVSIDLATGLWTGAAWGENIGWIIFDHSEVDSRAVSYRLDDFDDVLNERPHAYVCLSPPGPGTGQERSLFRSDVGRSGRVVFVDALEVIGNIGALVNVSLDVARSDAECTGRVTFVDALTVISHVGEVVDS
jgi:hypothetical protein